MRSCAVPAPRDKAFRLALLLLAAAQAYAPAFAADSLTTDRKGGLDNPVLSRYQGSVLYMFGESKLGTASVVTEQKGKAALLPVEGKVSNRLYLAPAGSSPLEVYRNYRHALEGAGYETVYACETAACEKANVQALIEQLPRKAVWAVAENSVQGTFNSANQPQFHYYSARRNGPAGPTYVSIGIVGGFAGAGVMSRVRQFVQIIEPATAELGKVTVDAKAITAGLKRDGKMALYGVNFDTNKAVLREDSAAQLAEMASALKAAPELKVFVVGHTDNQGEFSSNTSLSQKRAEAVTSALAGKYGIAANRLVARGVANLAPLASNEEEAGRAKNRRVEMVVR